MLNFLGRRLAQIVPTLFFVSVLIFSLQQLLPGDPALVMAGEERDPAVIEQIRHRYRLDQPTPVQYAYWIKGVLVGDFGESLRALVVITGDKPSADDLDRFCRERLAAYKCPKSYEIVPDLLRNAMGKLDKRAMHRPYWSSERTIAG